MSQQRITASILINSFPFISRPAVKTNLWGRPKKIQKNLIATRALASAYLVYIASHFLKCELISHLFCSQGPSYGNLKSPERLPSLGCPPLHILGGFIALGFGIALAEWLRAHKAICKKSQ